MMKDVVGYEGHYSVTEDGRVWSHKRNRFLVGGDKKGYRGVLLSKPGEKRVYKTVHRIVAEAYLPNPENRPQINHIDGDKLNNAVSNLEWITAKENLLHAVDNGLYEFRKYVIPRKFDSAVAGMIRDIHRVTGKTFVQIGRAYGVSSGTIANIIHRRKAYAGV